MDRDLWFNFSVSLGRFTRESNFYGSFASVLALSVSIQMYPNDKELLKVSTDSAMASYYFFNRKSSKSPIRMAKTILKLCENPSFDGKFSDFLTMGNLKKLDMTELI